MRRGLVVLAQVLLGPASQALLGACTPKVHLTILEAADVTVPAEVRTIAVVDATSDGEGAAAAVAGVAELLASGPRFAVVPDPAAADAVLALEAFASDAADHVTSRTIATVEAGRDVHRTEYTARRDVMAEATWRLTAAGREVDHLDRAGTTDTWTALGATREEAERGLPPLDALVEELGRSTGVAYGRRISPWYADVVRDYFVRGDPRLGAAKRAVRAGDWTTAIRLWNEVAGDGTDEARARAEYDLAVAYEVKGQYRRALTHAEEAARLDPSARIVRYRDLLEAELPERRTLREQLEAVRAEGGGP